MKLFAKSPEGFTPYDDDGVTRYVMDLPDYDQIRMLLTLVPGPPDTDIVCGISLFEHQAGTSEDNANIIVAPVTRENARRLADALYKMLEDA